MTWAGTGVLWTVAGGVPTLARHHRRGGGAADARASPSCRSATATWASTSPPIPTPKARCEEAIGTRQGAAGKAVLHDPHRRHHHLSKPSEFDDAEQHHLAGAARRALRARRARHARRRQGKLYLERYGKGTQGRGWYSFDADGVHFIGLVNVVDLKAGGLGNLGDEQLEWLEDDVKGRSASTADRRLRAYPAVDGLSGVGLGHRRTARGRSATSSASAR